MIAHSPLDPFGQALYIPLCQGCIPYSQDALKRMLCLGGDFMQHDATQHAFSILPDVYDCPIRTPTCDRTGRKGRQQEQTSHNLVHVVFPFFWFASEVTPVRRLRYALLTAAGCGDGEDKSREKHPERNSLSNGKPEHGGARIAAQHLK